MLSNVLNIRLTVMLGGVVMFSASLKMTEAISQEIPSELFGITLGSIYELGEPDKGTSGNLPIKKSTGFSETLGHGIHYFFQPQIQYKHFTYVEKRNSPDDQSFQTSFKLYLLPIRFGDISNKNPLKGDQAKWEVLAIEWSNGMDNQKDAYLWAKNLCQSYTNTLSIEPEITDYSNANWFECRFASDNKHLDVGGMGARANISLIFNSEVITTKENAITK